MLTFQKRGQMTAQMQFEVVAYHAIVYIPVPCEEACPVKAISKDKKGIEHIDESKCIYCGKCLLSLIHISVQDFRSTYPYT